MALHKAILNDRQAAGRLLSPAETAREIARLRVIRMREADREFAQTVRELKRVTRLFRDKLKSL